MNTETIALSMTPREADAIAHVLMAALHQPNFMLDNERASTTAAARALFARLGYGYTTDNHGNRVENAPPARTADYENDRAAYLDAQS